MIMSRANKATSDRLKAARSDRLRVAHLYQAAGMDLRRPQAAHLHIHHTMRGLRRAGHEVAFLGIEGKRVLFLQNGSFEKLLSANGSLALAEPAYGKLGLTGARPFSLFEGGVRRLQTTLRVPYFALFDSLHMLDGAVQNLKGYDLLHERYNLLSLGGVLAGKRLGLPLVLEVNADLLAQRELRGTPERGVRRVFARWATRLSFRAAARVICVSADLAHHLQRRWRVDAARLVVLPCAADTEAFGREGNAAAVRARLGLQQAPVVMWVGGFYEWHALDLLVAAFAAVRDRFPQARLVLVGDGETRGRIAAEVARLGLGEAVIMTGAVPHAAIPELVSVADVAVAPAPAMGAAEGGTGAPLKLFEYMAAGKPVVASAVVQARAVVEHEQTGLLVEPDDAAAFACAMEQLLAHPEKRRRLGENARRRAVERHSWQQYTRKLEAVYDDLLAERGGRGRA